LKNIDWIQTVTDTIVVESWTSDQLYQIDETNSRYTYLTLPALVEGEFTQVEMTKETGVVGGQTSFSTTLTTQNSVQKDGYLTIDIPDDTF
jgi:hypothetical protein